MNCSTVHLIEPQYLEFVFDSQIHNNLCEYWPFFNSGDGIIIGNITLS